MSGGLTPRLREAALERARYECEYCEATASEVDHIVPRSRSGSDDLENLAAACFECNRQKSALTPDEWADVRIADGKPWPIPSLTARITFLLAQGVRPKIAWSGRRQVIDRDSYKKNYRPLITALRDVPLGAAT